MNQTNSVRKALPYGAILTALIFLCNPNISVLDILPDFIAFLLLARVFERHADTVPYFEEARIGCVRLMWLNLAKVGAMVLIVFVRQRNNSDGDIVALCSLVFAVCEGVLSVQTVCNIFSGLFYLGERSNATALISPYPAGARHAVLPERVRRLTLLFVICKSVLYGLPQLALLSYDRQLGSPAQHFFRAALYPMALALSLLIGLVLGAVWLVSAVRYLRAIRSEGHIADALENLTTDVGTESVDQHQTCRRLLHTLSLLTVASFCTLELTFSDFRDINLLPHFIFGILCVCALFRMERSLRGRKAAILSGGLYCVAGAVFYVLYCYFLTRYGYEALERSQQAVRVYRGLYGAAICEFVTLLPFLFFSCRVMAGFLTAHTGLSPDSPRYNTRDREYHRALRWRATVWYILAGVCGAAKFLQVFLNGSVKTILSNIEGDVPAIGITVTSRIEWFPALVFALAVLYIGYTLYFCSLVKEEVKTKYGYGDG